jgi:hypothetical protein
MSPERVHTVSSAFQQEFSTVSGNWGMLKRKRAVLSQRRRSLAFVCQAAMRVR